MYTWNLKKTKQTKTKTDSWKQKPKGWLPEGGCGKWVKRWRGISITQ